jgi:hypothetical protein
MVHYKFSQLTSFFHLIILTFSLILFNCSKSEEKEESLSPNAPSVGEVSSSVQMDTEDAKLDNAPRKKIANELNDKPKENNSSLKDEEYQVQFAGIDPKLGRLLEYNVSIEFESENFKKTRDDLYKLSSIYGFLQESNDTFYQEKSLNASVWIRTEKLYEFLEASNTLGKLRTESILANDLTFDNYSQTVTLNREFIRSRRRSSALSGSSDARNYTERERLLAESEDREDTATKEKWQIQDKVSWAKVQITVFDPSIDNTVKIPNFTTVFYDLTSAFLYLVYISLYGSPFLLVGIFLWFKRNWFLKMFSFKKT